MSWSRLQVCGEVKQWRSTISNSHTEILIWDILLCLGGSRVPPSPPLPLSAGWENREGGGWVGALGCVLHLNANQAHRPVRPRSRLSLADTRAALPHPPSSAFIFISRRTETCQNLGKAATHIFLLICVSPRRQTSQYTHWKDTQAHKLSPTHTHTHLQTHTHTFPKTHKHAQTDNCYSHCSNWQ